MLVRERGKLSRTSNLSLSMYESMSVVNCRVCQSFEVIGYLAQSFVVDVQFVSKLS